MDDVINCLKELCEKRTLTWSTIWEVRKYYLREAFVKNVSDNFSWQPDKYTSSLNFCEEFKSKFNSYSDENLAFFTRVTFIR